MCRFKFRHFYLRFDLLLHLNTSHVSVQVTVVTDKGASLHLNTSHVSVQADVVGKVVVVIPFKYITCVGSSVVTLLLMMVHLDLNTSHVSVQVRTYTSKRFLY